MSTVIEVLVADSVDRSNRFPFVCLVRVVIDEVEVAKYNLRKTNKSSSVSIEFIGKKDQLTCFRIEDKTKTRATIPIGMSFQLLLIENMIEIDRLSTLDWFNTMITKNN